MAHKKHTKLFEWQEKVKKDFEGECANCNSKENITVDHIIPISILEPLYLDSPAERYDLIYNDEQNFQYLCKYCNVKKAGKLDIRNPKTIPLLQELLNKLK